MWGWTLKALKPPSGGPLIQVLNYSYRAGHLVRGADRDGLPSGPILVAGGGGESQRLLLGGVLRLIFVLQYYFEGLV